MTAKEQHIELITGIPVSVWNENDKQLSLIIAFKNLFEKKKQFLLNKDKKIECFTID